jgi:DNA-binding MarR family transcriptional regulator
MARRSERPIKPIDPDSRPAEVSLGWLGTTVGYYLRTAQEAAFEDFARRADGADAQPWRFAILALIDSNPGITQGDLAAALRRRTSTLTPALNELVRRGYVDRKRVKTDRRAYALSLTERGHDAMLQLMASAVEHERDLDRLVGSRNRSEFIRILRGIAEGFSRKNSGGLR